MAYALGTLSAVPFLALTPHGLDALNAFADSHGQPRVPLSVAEAARLQLLYGASVLSFLGAPHWGLAMAGGATAEANVARLVWGVTPSLVAVPLPLLPEAPARAVLVQSLAVCLSVDALFSRAQLLPRWYFVGLRIPLSALAVGSLLVAAPAPHAPPGPPVPPPPPPPLAPPAGRSRWL
jgi:hypothetical protein